VQLQHLVLLVLQWLDLDTARGRFGFMAPWFLIWAALALHTHLPTLAVCYLIIYFFCRRRAQ
jgi:hypothetical protein